MIFVRRLVFRLAGPIVHHSKGDWLSEAAFFKRINVDGGVERTEPSNDRRDWPLWPRASRGLAGEYAGLSENPCERGLRPVAVRVDRAIPHDPSRIRI